jgi:hypothetical protein
MKKAKKPTARLTLYRETLRLLEAEEIRTAAGGATVSICVNETCGCSNRRTFCVC